MRVLHTADWHLGKLFYNRHLTDDQAYILEGLVDLARQSDLDAVVVSGDIYDRAVPPPEAVDLLNDVLTQLVVELGIPTIVIAGNHDGPDRLGFGSKILARSRLHIVGNPSVEAQRIGIETDDGTLQVYAVPYADPAYVRALVGDDTVHDHHAAMDALLAPIRPKPGSSACDMLVTHAFVAGGEESESERPLSVGGAGTVGAGLFDGWDYVALGHLHRPQSVSRGSVRYSGSLLKYSFAEAQHVKSVTIVDIDPQTKRVNTEQVELPVRRDVRTISGRIDDLLANPETVGRDDYLSVDLLDEGPVFDAMGRLRAVYPNVLWAGRPIRPVDTKGDARTPAPDRLSDLDLFTAFYKYVTDEELEGEGRNVLTGLLEELEQSRREVSS